MKKKEIVIFLGLLVATFVFSEWLAMKFVSRPTDIHLSSALQVDSLNDAEYSQVMKTYQFIAQEVIKKGMRNDDVMVMMKTKSVLESFHEPLQRISSAQQTLVHEMDGKSITSELRDSVEQLIGQHSSLRIFIDSLNASLPDYQPISSFVLDENFKSEDVDALYSGLTVLESLLLSTATHLIQDYAEDVGAKDVAFDVWPELDQSVRIDSVINYFNEQYDQIYENPYLAAISNPLSTFSIDVDRAAYTNVKRYIENGFLPPADAVKIEELINYFDYEYPEPQDHHPVAITTEYAKCPWNDQHNLLMIGLKGEDLNRKLNFEELPPNNLNFLIDVSGSMGYGEKLPLVKSSLKKLVDKLRPEDKVSIVVYAGAAGIVLPPTSGNQKTEIVEALDRLSAGGSTAGGEGIKLAYKVAKENFIKNGNNRIIICTDGDFNVGPSSDTDMEQLVNGYKDSGIYITCLGFGMGNYKDSKMEAIAESGEGNYAYIDSQNEADYVFGSGLTGTLYTIAKDVKIQVEFNPEVVKGYRLIGYENRMLIPEDFMNDQVDARDLGSGHTVTALYEIIPVGDTSDLLKPVAPLRYQSAVLTDSQITDEVGTVKFRYKLPQTKVSTEVVNLVKNELSVNPGRNFRLSTAVAEYGLLLRRSKHKAAANYESILSRVENAYIQTENQQPWEEFIRLAQNAQSVKPLY